MNHVKFNSRAGAMHKYTFPSFSALEEFFLNNIQKFKGCKSKVIGKTLLVWKK